MRKPRPRTSVRRPGLAPVGEYMGHYSNYGVIANDLNISTIVVKKLIDGIPNYLEDKYRIVFQMN